MESLYRKYRPQTFDDVVGQQHVVTTLKRAVLEGRTSHAYLFCGPRGTGKTTMARLLAKALLCEEGPGHLPDGTCEQCRLIAAGEHPDVYELDAASNTGVDNVREEIINRVAFAPVRGSYKVYIIDEVHMLTTAAFNALLKTLEEPPAHVVFVLCTTDPQKVLETILSRVQRFDFHAIGDEELVGRLVYVCEREGFAYDQRALELVARHARGGMRDALTKLEQLATATGGQVSLEAAQALLGEVSTEALREVARALAQRDVPTLFAEAALLTEEGRDLLTFVHELAAHLRDVYVVACVGARPGVVTATEEELRQLGEEAAAFGPADRIARALAVLADASTEMRVATNQRLVLELAFTRLARPETELTLEAMAERVAVLERSLARLEAAGRGVVAAPSEGAPSVPSAAVPVAAPRQRSEQRQAPAAQTPAPQSPTSERREAPAAPQRQAPAAQAPAAQAPAAPQRQAPTGVPVPRPAAKDAEGARPARAGVVDPGELQRKWRQVCDELVASAPARGSLLMRSTIVSDDGSRLVVSLPEGSTFACKMLERSDVRDAVAPFVARAFGPRTVSYVEGAAAAAPAVSVAAPAPLPAPEPTRLAAPAAPAPQATVAMTPPPMPTPAQAPTPAAPTQTPAPAAPTQAPAPAAPATGYAMPWDEDEPPYDEPPYDEVPLEDIDASYYAAEEAAAGFAAPPTPVPAPKPQAPAPAKPAPAPQAPVPERPTPAPASAPQPSASATPEQGAFARTPDLADQDGILAMLTNVFGEGVSIHTERTEPVLAEGEYLEDSFEDGDSEE